MSTIDYSALGKAIERLKEGVKALEREPENTLYRDAVIQRFEFTYGLCARLLARHLERSAPEPPQKDISFPTLIRTASERGLLKSGWDTWFDIRKARNLTSHTYNEQTARTVVAQVPGFLIEAEFLYRELQREQ